VGRHEHVRCDPNGEKPQKEHAKSKPAPGETERDDEKTERGNDGEQPESEAAGDQWETETADGKTQAEHHGLVNETAEQRARDDPEDCRIREWETADLFRRSAQGEKRCEDHVVLESPPQIGTVALEADELLELPRWTDDGSEWLAKGELDSLQRPTDQTTRTARCGVPCSCNS
jgi:hypothetical protein